MAHTVGIVLPQRHPLVLAKQVASVDVPCSGRLILGIGAGHLEPELSAVGVAMAERGARTDAYLAAMRSMWEDEAPEIDTPFARFAGIDAHPRPVQRPLPIVVGGHAAAAHRRAARSADGWYGFMLSPETAAEQVASLRAAETQHPRTRPLHISVTPERRLDPTTVQAYAEAGVDRLIVAPRPGSAARDLLRFVAANAPDASRNS